MTIKTDKAGTVLTGHAPEISSSTLLAEAAGAGLLAFLIVAAGILAERYVLQSPSVVLVITALIGAGGFFILSHIFVRQIRCYFTPVLAFVLILDGSLPLAAGLICTASQILAAMTGVMAAHLVTNTGLVQTASLDQIGTGTWLGEAAASASFVFTGLATLARSRSLMPLSGAACLLIIAFATPSISFANPALTLARSLTDSFTAIALTDAMIIAAIQLAAGAGGWAFYRWRNAKPL